MIHRTFRKRSLCVNGSPALFPDRVALLGSIVWRNVRKARHFAVSAHRRSDPAKIDLEAPPNGAFERFWGPKPGMYPKNVQCGRLYFRYILSDHADKRSLCKFIFSTAVKCDHKLFLRHPVHHGSRNPGGIGHFCTKQYWLTIKGSSPGDCLLYTSPSPRDGLRSRMPSSA